MRKPIRPPNKVIVNTPSKASQFISDTPLTAVLPLTVAITPIIAIRIFTKNRISNLISFSGSRYFISRDIRKISDDATTATDHPTIPKDTPGKENTACTTV